MCVDIQRSLCFTTRDQRQPRSPFREAAYTRWDEGQPLKRFMEVALCCCLEHLQEGCYGKMQSKGEGVCVNKMCVVFIGCLPLCNLQIINVLYIYEIHKQINWKDTLEIGKNPYLYGGRLIFNKHFCIAEIFFLCSLWDFNLIPYIGQSHTYRSFKNSGRSTNFPSTTSHILFPRDNHFLTFSQFLYYFFISSVTCSCCHFLMFYCLRDCLVTSCCE